MHKFGRFITAIAMAAALAIGAAPAYAVKVQNAQTAPQTKPAQLPKKKVNYTTQSSAKDCQSFLQCLFSKKSGKVRSGSNVFRGSTRTTVAWTDGKYKPGSIIVRTPERALYLVMADGKALRYSVGVGREGFQWSGNSTIIGKTEWPDWRPPKVMIEREAAKGHIIPDFMEGGPENPLGARAMYIGGTMFRIHGTNNAASIGGAVSSGCIRMLNEDVIDLYGRVKVGARVYVYQ